MKKRVIAMVIVIVVSGMAFAGLGAYMKYEILKPLDIAQDKNIIELPFLLMTDEGLRFVVEEAFAAPTKPSVPMTSQPSTESATSPTNTPTIPPTMEPTVSPTMEPTVSPTMEPTVSPTMEPTVPPTAEPTVPPTAEPTVPPTTEPTVPPTADPSDPTATDSTEPPHAHAFVDTVYLPDCTTNGYTWYQCECGAGYSDDETPATGHTFIDTEIAPACTTQGYTWRECQTCGYGYADHWVSALGHSYSSAVTAPTPEAEGYTEHTCSVCGRSYRDSYTQYSPTETTEPADSDSTAPPVTDPPKTPTTEPTVPPTTEPTVPPTTEPTVPPTTEPTAPSTVPSSYSYPHHDFSRGAVPDSWYDNVLFIGDSRTVGLRDYARSGNAEYFCSVGMSVFNYDDRACADTNFSSQTLASLLSSRTYEKIFISLGINECGYATSSLMNAYQSLIDLVRQYQPNAKIILQGIMMVTKGYAGSTSYFQPSHINSINERIEQLADWSTIYYIDVNQYFTNVEGFLYSDITGDGCHLYASYYGVWAQWISFAVGKFGI